MGTVRPPARPERESPEGSQGLDGIVPIKAGRWLTFGSLGLLLLFFIALQCLLPLRTAVKSGDDEDFELSKATLCMHGYQLYTQI